jgi:hypothetical protein
MNPDATVVFNKAELAKAIHEETNAGPSGADHFRQSFLADLRNQRFRWRGKYGSFDSGTYGRPTTAANANARALPWLRRKVPTVVAKAP